MRALDLSVARVLSAIPDSAEQERFLVFDTETTGLGADHRVIEIGVVEIVNRRVTGREFHVYINPERSIDADAERVHGLSSRFLADKPKFHEIADEFVAFVGDEGKLVAHNATFDINKLNAEFERIGSSFRINAKFEIIDTMKLSKKMFPGQRATMDALCSRLGVSAHEREISGLHGALIDSRILSRVFLQITAGQVQLGYSEGRLAIAAAGTKIDRLKFPMLKVVYPSPDEETSHARLCDTVEKTSGGYCGFRGKWTKPEKETAKMDAYSKAAEFGAGTIAAAQPATGTKPGLSHLVMTASVTQPSASTAPATTQIHPAPAVAEGKPASVTAAPATEVEFSPSI